jgi:hypothetical protein
MPRGSVKVPRIKYYGLFWISKPTYLALQATGLVLILAIMAVGTLGMVHSGQWFPQIIPPPDGVPVGWGFKQFIVGLFWLGLLTLALEGIETVVMLKKFAREEALERARQSNPETDRFNPQAAPADSDAVQAREGMHAQRPPHQP